MICYCLNEFVYSYAHENHTRTEHWACDNKACVLHWNLKTKTKTKGKIIKLCCYVGCMRLLCWLTGIYVGHRELFSSSCCFFLLLVVVSIFRSPFTCCFMKCRLQCVLKMQHTRHIIHSIYTNMSVYENLLHITRHNDCHATIGASQHHSTTVTRLLISFLFLFPIDLLQAAYY